MMYRDNIIIFFDPKQAGRFVALYDFNTLIWSDPIPSDYDGSWFPAGVIVEESNKFAILPKSDSGFVTIFDYNTRLFTHVYPPKPCYALAAPMVRGSYILSYSNNCFRTNTNNLTPLTKFRNNGFGYTHKHYYVQYKY
jgi:hypothetical protein